MVGSPVSPRQHRHTQTAAGQESADGDDGRCLARTACGKGSDGDDRPVQSLGLENAGTIETAAGPVDAPIEQLQRFQQNAHASNSTIRRAVRSDAPRFCSTVLRARSPHWVRKFVLSSIAPAKSTTSAALRTWAAASLRRKTCAISRKLDIDGPKQTGTPAAAGSI